MPFTFSTTVPPCSVVKVCATVAACPVGVAIVIGSPSGSESLPVTLENNGTSVKSVNESSEAIGIALYGVDGLAGSTGTFRSRTSIETSAVSTLPLSSATV